MSWTFLSVDEALHRFDAVSVGDASPCSNGTTVAVGAVLYIECSPPNVYDHQHDREHGTPERQAE